MGTLSGADDIRDLRPKFTFIYVIVGLAFVILVSRLWYLQIIRGDRFFDFSRTNSFKLVSIPASRGRIFDRTGAVIADNHPSYQALLLRQYVQNLSSMTATTAELLKIPVEDIEEAIDKARGQAKFLPIVLKDNLTHEQLARIEVNRVFLPGLDTAAVPIRNYAQDRATFHLLGYLGEVNKDELASFTKDHPGVYKQSDIIGKNGIERAMDRYLKGQDGGEQVAVDARGRRTEDVFITRDLQDQKPVPGNDLVLTIDMRMQAKARDLFEAKGYAGSAVVMDVRDGSLLVYYSSPTLDPYMFARGITQAEWSAVQADPKKPLIDKSIAGQYPPGSTYKMIVALAGLELGLITPHERITCPGFFNFGKRPFRCWNAKGHGSVDLHDAIVQSCDVYFYKLGLRVGIDRLAEYAKRLGYGAVTGIGINNEQAGLIPSSEWKKRVRHEPWMEGETVSCAIGQGYDLVTPLQHARGIAALVNGGRVFRPWVVREVRTPGGETVKTFEGEQLNEVKFNAHNLQAIMEGMRDVVQTPHGTAYYTRLPNVIHGGKTGTSQVVRMAEGKRTRTDDLAYLQRDHSWFVAFAPYDNPEISVAVLVEHGGHGSTAAAPIARDLIAKYFESKQKDSAPQNPEEAPASEENAPEPSPQNPQTTQQIRPHHEG